MSNYSNEINLKVFTVAKNDVDKSIVQSILSIDNDFTENKEYFREDTLELGYLNEAERYASEIYDECREYQCPRRRLGEMLNKVQSISSFLINNANYCNGNEIEITETDNMFVISIAYLT